MSTPKQNNPDHLGKVAYDAYCGTRDWKSVRGEPLPQWDKCDAGIQAGWIAAAAAVLEADTSHFGFLVSELATYLESTAKEFRRLNEFKHHA